MAQIQIKRTTTANNAPTGLAHGELAAGLADDPIKMWIGTPTGVKPLPLGGVISQAMAPANVPLNSLWFNETDGVLYFWHDDGTSEQWVSLSGPEGPQGAIGPTGPLGPIGPAATLTHVSNALTVNRTGISSTWVEVLNIDIGTVGTWLVTATATITDQASRSGFASLQSGSEVIASAGFYIMGATVLTAVAMSGIVINPTAPISLNVRAAAAANMQVYANITGLSRDTNITAVRIA